MSSHVDSATIAYYRWLSNQYENAPEPMVTTAIEIATALLEHNITPPIINEPERFREQLMKGMLASFLNFDRTYKKALELKNKLNPLDFYLNPSLQIEISIIKALAWEALHPSFRSTLPHNDNARHIWGWYTLQLSPQPSPIYDYFDLLLTIDKIARPLREIVLDNAQQLNTHRVPWPLINKYLEFSGYTPVWQKSAIVDIIEILDPSLLINSSNCF